MWYHTTRKDKRGAGSPMAESAYRDPIYNLKAVVESTGVTADALRAWERRYGLPQPARTEAGHRIYSQRDIDITKWLVARQEEGLRIGRAVKLWRSLVGEGQDPLRTMPLPKETTIRRAAHGDTIAELREEWVSASLAFDEEAAEQAVTSALAMYPPEIVCSQIIGEGIARIGHRWWQGDVTPQQEHFASRLAVRRLETLLEGTPRPTRRGRILAAAPPGEEHVLGLLTLTLLLRRSGWDVVYLGADVPLEEMSQTIAAIEPDLIILAAQQLHAAANLLAMARVAEQEGVPLGFGGRVFNQEPGLRKRVPGHYLGPTVGEAPHEVERLMTTAVPTPDVERPSEPEETARAHYRDRQVALESDVWQAMSDRAPDPRILITLNETVGRALDAALAFGDLDLLGRQLDWLESLDGRHRAGTDLLDRYLRAYHDAAKTHLDDRGALIVDWLGERIAEEPTSG